MIPASVVRARGVICARQACGACADRNLSDACAACPSGHWPAWDCGQGASLVPPRPSLPPVLPLPVSPVRSLAEQERILTVVCPACPHGMWKGSHCGACAGAGCFSARVADARQHCPKREW